MEDRRFWGVAVKPGEIVRCDPGEGYYGMSQIALEVGKLKENVEVFVNIDNERIKLGTLSADNDYFLTDLVFNKKFELFHSSRASNICFTGNTFKIMKRSNASAKGGDESDEEVPLPIPLDSNISVHKNNEATHGASKLTAPRPADTLSSIPKATVKETTSPGKPKGDDKKIEGKKRPLEIPLRTPQGKKVKIGTPTTDIKTGVEADAPFSIPKAKAGPGKPKGDDKGILLSHNQASSGVGHVNVIPPTVGSHEEVIIKRRGKYQVSVGNLHNDVKSETLMQLFEADGIVRRDHGLFTTLFFRRLKDALKAVTHNRTVLKGYEIVVEWVGYSVMNSTLFIRGFDSSFSVERVRHIIYEKFSACGKIKRVTIPTVRRVLLREKRRIRGIAFVQFEHESSIPSALLFDNSFMDGSRIELRLARPKLAPKSSTTVGKIGKRITFEDEETDEDK